jgi:hypothetical protein
VFPFGKAKAFSLEKTLGAVLQPKDPGRMGLHGGGGSFRREEKEEE